MQRQSPAPGGDLDGATFRVRVYAWIRRIPPGRVATYGQIARLAGAPRSARHVGRALAGVPRGMELPWHRVINAQGRISHRAPSPSRAVGSPERRQRRLLEGEGVRFRNGTVDLAQYRWEPAADHDRL